MFTKSAFLFYILMSQVDTNHIIFLGTCGGDIVVPVEHAGRHGDHCRDEDQADEQPRPRHRAPLSREDMNQF